MSKKNKTNIGLMHPQQQMFASVTLEVPAMFVLKTQYDILITENENLKKERDELIKELDKSNKRYSTLERTSDEQQRRISDLEDENIKLRKSNDQLREELREARKDISILRGEVAELKKKDEDRIKQGQLAELIFQLEKALVHEATKDLDIDIQFDKFKEIKSSDNEMAKANLKLTLDKYKYNDKKYISVSKKLKKSRLYDAHIFTDKSPSGNDIRKLAENTSDYMKICELVDILETIRRSQKIELFYVYE